MNATLLRLELRRVWRDPVTLFFTVGLPGFLFLVFGTSESWAGESVGNGNVGMAIMIAMAAYGAVTATVGIGGRAALDRAQGWGRQIGLTPLRDRTFVGVKTTAGVVVAALPMALIYALGTLTGAEGTGRAWLLSAVVLLAGAVVFGLYGLVFGLFLRSESALAAASGSVVVLAFLGNIFFPLSGFLLDVGRWTPLYGYVSLARYPLTEGWIVSGDGPPVHEALWMPVTNLLAWTTVFAILATWLVRRGRARP